MLKKENFDAMFVGHLFPCGSALSYALDIKVHFLIHSCPIMDHMAAITGLPLPLGYVPTTGNLETLDIMNFYNRATNEFESWMGMSYSKVFDSITKVFKKHYGANFPDVKTVSYLQTLFF